MNTKLFLSVMTVLLPLFSFSQRFFNSVLDKSLNRLAIDESDPGISVLISENDENLYYYSRGISSLDRGQKIGMDTRFRMASVSKQVTAFAVYCLLEKKQISLQDSLGTFFDGLAPTIATIPIQQLLNHSSGIPDYENLIPQDQKVQVSDADVLRLLGIADRPYFEPGSRFKYSNTAYCLLALIVERVSGQHFADFVQQYLFHPAGIANGLVYSPDSRIKERAYGYHPTQQQFVFADQSLTSATKGDGGVYFSARDYHQWANFIISNYFSKKAFKDFFLKNASVVKDKVIYNFGFFAVPEKDGDLILFHSGESTGFNNMVYIDVDRHIILSAFSNRDDFLIGRAFALVMQDREIVPPVKTIGSANLFEWLNKVYEGEDY